MCLVKKPKITTAAEAEKPVQVFTNRYFVDRGEDAVAARQGRNALKIDRGTTRPTNNNPAPSQLLIPGVQAIGPSGPQAPTMGGDMRYRGLNGMMMIK